MCRFRALAASPVLELGLDFPLPADVRVGAGTALFVCGWCFCADSDVRSLALLVDGRQQPVMDHGMPRRDVLDSFAVPRSYRSGFWGLARLDPNGGGEREIGLWATLDDGTELVADLAGVAGRPAARRAAVDPGARARQRPARGDLHGHLRPSGRPLRRQLESIRAQTYPNWVCVMSDDCSSPGAAGGDRTGA